MAARMTIADFQGWFTEDLSGSPGLGNLEEEVVNNNNISGKKDLVSPVTAMRGSPRGTAEKEPLYNNDAELGDADEGSSSGARQAAENSSERSGLKEKESKSPRHVGARSPCDTMTRTRCASNGHLLSNAATARTESPVGVSDACTTAVQPFGENQALVCEAPIFRPVRTKLDHLFASQKATCAESRIPAAHAEHTDHSSDDENFKAEAASFLWHTETTTQQRQAPLSGMMTDSSQALLHLGALPSRAFDVRPAAAATSSLDNEKGAGRRSGKKSVSISEEVEVIRTWHRAGALALVIANLMLCVAFWTTLRRIDDKFPHTANCGLFTKVFAIVVAADLVFFQQLVLLLKVALRWLVKDPLATQLVLGFSHPLEGDVRA
jgi:hypothetical protein